MKTNDEDKAPMDTPADLTARKIIGWHQACSDAERILHYSGAGQRKISEADIGKSVGDLLYDCLNAKRQEFDPE
jgi:hypothetical protein